MADTAPQPSAEDRLNEFIFHPDQFRMNDIPRGLKVPEISDFVEEKLDSSSEPQAWLQAEKVISHYDVYEVCAHVQKTMDKRPVDLEEQLRFICWARILARVGPPADRNLANTTFASATPRAKVVRELEALASLVEAMGPDGDVKTLGSAVDKRLQAMQGDGTAETKKNDYDQLEFLQTMTLPRMTQANKLKEGILKMSSRSARIQREVNHYLGLEPAYPEYIPSWAAQRLRREVWGDKPDEQWQRSDDPQRSADVVAAFRSALAAIDRHADLPERDKDSLRVRALRAIDFFGEPLTPEEQEFVEQKSGAQSDILANE